MNYLNKLDKTVWIWAAMNHQLVGMLSQVKESKTKCVMNRIKKNADDTYSGMLERAKKSELETTIKKAALGFDKASKVFNTDISVYAYLGIVHLIGMAVYEKIRPVDERHKILKQRIRRWLGSLLTLHDHIQDTYQKDEEEPMEQASEAMREVYEV